jgi:hypothetical protein
MKEGAKLHVQQINHGQSDIWLAADANELSARRRIATNEVVNVTRRHCTPEAFEAFYADYHKGIDHIAILSVPNLDLIAAELRLQA